jgi:hypothetical protein
MCLGLCMNIHIYVCAYTSVCVYIPYGIRESYVTTDGQSASLSWNETPVWGPRPDFCYFQTVADFLMWGVLSDGRTGLSFIITACPCMYLYMCFSGGKAVGIFYCKKIVNK